jgi:hypothetical protein
MSAIVPIAKTVAKKVIPKSKKGKVAGAAAAAFGVSAVRDNNKQPQGATAMTPSIDAQNANAPVGASTDNKGLLNLPVGTPIRAGASGFPGVPYRPDYSGPTYTTASAIKGDAEKFLANQSAPEKAALLLRLGQIPNLYPSGQAPTPAYVQSMGNRIIWRPSDATALEGILRVQDQLGDPTPNATLSNLISNPVLASKFFGRVTTKAKAVTPLAAIEAELNDKFLDLFETQADAKLIKSYAKEVNALESSPAGITAQQKEDILLKYIQKKANEVYNISQTGLTPGAIDKGALGRTVRSIRSAYDDNGIPTNEKDIYNKAVQSLRSADAYKNVIDGVMMQASTVMPAFKDLFAQGKNAREVLSPWINTRSQVLGIPADQIKVSDMYEIGSGPTPLSIQDYKKQLYRSPEFKKTDAYKQRSLGDMQTLLRAFNIG